MSCNETVSPMKLFGAGFAHITLLKNAKGECVDPPQVVQVPAIQNFSSDFVKADVKTMHGNKQWALAAAQGKMSCEISFECGEMHAQYLNNICLAQTFKKGGSIIYSDNVGHDLPDTAAVIARIQNVRTFNLGNLIANTSLTIKQGAAHVAATLVGGTADLVSGQYRFSQKTYEFAKDDVGKEAKISWVCLDKTTQGGVIGTDVVTTITIPSKRTVMMNAWSKFTSISGGLIKDAYSTSATPAVGHYSVQDNGTFIFNSAQTATVLSVNVTTHTTDGIVMKSTIATLPAAGYVAIVNPPSASSFVADAGVILSGGVIAGLAIGDSFAKNASPATGQYDVDLGGIYTFAAADVNAVVKVNFVPDYMAIAASSPGGDIIKDKGVMNQNGMPFTRVALVQPLSLANDQYATDDAGNYFFDWTNRLDKLYISFEYETPDGATTTVENNDMGSTPIMALDFSQSFEGRQCTFKFAKVVPKAGSFSTKQDDFGMTKFSFEAFAQREGGKVADLSFS
jgi:hypothetical protein